MAYSNNLLLFCFFFSLCFLSSYARTNCSDFHFHGKSYNSCSHLHTLNSFIHWNYDMTSRTVDIAFSKSESQHGRWLAWAINPTSTGMTGSQYIAFTVHNVSAQYINGQVIIFARFEMSSPNVKLNSRSKIKIVHGVINAVSWGMMMPLGVVLARLRYLPLQEYYSALWFNLHIYCQSIAYFLGIAGGGLGFYLGRQSSSVKQHSCHRYIGAALLMLATFQVLAHRLRPSKEHKYRVYWNIYHWCTGYGTIIMGILNCFKGFQMTDVGIWKNAYIAFLASLSFVAVVLEVCRCYLTANKGTATPEGVSANSIEDKA
uniref:Cytochrome b561 domain-containing protein n=1 Tax=Solanum lycopersicum TaxID=4081 RepID=K4B6N2_SOLLC